MAPRFLVTGGAGFIGSHIVEARLGRGESVRDGDVTRSFAAIERAEELLGYRPLVSFGEGLRRTVAWYRQAGFGG